MTYYVFQKNHLLTKNNSPVAALDQIVRPSDQIIGQEANKDAVFYSDADF